MFSLASLFIVLEKKELSAQKCWRIICGLISCVKMDLFKNKSSLEYQNATKDFVIHV